MMSQITAIIRPLAWGALFLTIAFVAAGLFSTMRAPVAEPAASHPVAGSAPVATARATEEPERTAAAATATAFPPTTTPPPATPGADQFELNPVDVRGAEARAHRQVSERFSMSVNEAQAAASFPVRLPSRLPASFASIGAEAADG